jgi:serine/threonine protein kinase
MSPERIQNHEYGFSADVWGLGLVLHELATGAFPFPESRSQIDMVQTLLEALAHMHAMGVAHLDLKPQNVLIHPPSGNLKLIDYGTAALFEPLVEGEPAPLFWPLVEEHGGTKSFQSPERIFEDYVEFGKDKEGFDGPAVDEILGLRARGLRSVVLLPLGYRQAEGDWLVNLQKVRWPREKFITEVR